MHPKKERYRRIRGLILKLLAYQHPGAMDYTMLRFTLESLGFPLTEDEFDSHLAYLADATKGYVSLERKKAGALEIKQIIITPKGLDLLDGFHPESDPGVDVEHL